jgi:hypothetical protein
MVAWRSARCDTGRKASMVALLEQHPAAVLTLRAFPSSSLDMVRSNQDLKSFRILKCNVIRRDYQLLEENGQKEVYLDR